jgi:hypothetical protein
MGSSSVSDPVEWSGDVVVVLILRTNVAAVNRGVRALLALAGVHSATMHIGPLRQCVEADVRNRERGAQVLSFCDTLSSDCPLPPRQV